MALAIAAALVAATIGALPSQAGPRVEPWAERTASVNLGPAKIVATATEGEPLEVVVTKVTDDGPEFETVIADSVSEAKSIIGESQDESDTIAVSMAQPIGIAVSNDTYRADQWALTTLRAETAWASSGGNGIKVAVVDTGVQASHPDLSGQVLSGYNALNGGSNVNDGNGHGTHLSGIIAATANNRRGIAGLARFAKILPVKVLDANGEGSTDVVARGITWAADHGAQVINLSLSGGHDPAMQTAIEYAQSKNIVVVAAAGNTGCLASAPATYPATYPAAYPGVVGVGSIDKGLTVSSFSSCGNWVDVVAPGGSITSTWTGSGYSTISGTSMATPYVAALAAMSIAKTGESYQASQVETLIQAKAGDLGATGRDDKYGYGLVNPVATLGPDETARRDTRIKMSVSPSSIIAGSAVNISGGLTYTDGLAIAGRQVRVKVTINGAAKSYATATTANGSFTLGVKLPDNATLTAYSDATATTNASSFSANYTKVMPKWSYTKTTSKVTVTNYSRYGQTLRLQKRVNGAWKNFRPVIVTSGKTTWTAKTGRGTWRLSSLANRKMAARVSGSWKS